MLLDELRTKAGAVQVQPLLDIVSHADIQRAVLSAGENVDVVHGATRCADRKSLSGVL